VKKYSLILLAFLACGKEKIKSTGFLREIKVKDKTIYVRLATSPPEWERGLMYTSYLPDSEGMLFVFPESQILSFWMKNTPIGLSIAYIDEDGVIREIHDMKAFDESTITSKIPCKYVLEVNSSWFKRNNINIGDTVIFPWISK
jgi:uncharacterized membrane protein (UPF0127 family)